MTPQALADRVVAADTPEQALVILRSQPVAGVSEAYFQKIASLLGSNPQAAAHAASLWRAVREAGDEPAYALRAKAVGERLMGQWGKSAKSFVAAGRLATDPVNRLAFKIGAVDSLARAGQVESAVRLGKLLRKGLNEIGETTLAARTSLNIGNALLWQDRHKEARFYLSEAIDPLTEAGMGVEAASARLGLSTSLLFAGNTRKALHEAEDALREFDNLEMPFHAAIAQVNIAHARILGGEPDTAIDVLLQVEPKLAESSIDGANVREYLGDAYLRLNLWEEAVDSFARSLRAPTRLPKANRANCHFGIGIAKAASGDRAGANTNLIRAGRLFLELGLYAWASSTFSKRAELERSAGRHLEAAVLSRQALNLADRTRSAYHRLEALIVAARLAIDSGDSPDKLLRSAKALQRRNGFRGHHWKLQALEAFSARGAERLRLLRRAYRSILQDRARTTSITSRMSFLRDKEEVLRELMRVLLAEPSRSRVREAIGIVENTRAIALLDEIATASAILTDRQRKALEELRTDIAAAEPETMTGAPIRGSRTAGDGALHLRSRWIETSRGLDTAVRCISNRAPSGASVIFVETDNRYFALTGSQAVPLSLRPDDVTRDLPWLDYEILAPLTGAPLGETHALDRVARTALRDWGQTWPTNLCLTGALWNLPWPVLFDAASIDAEPVYCLHPSAHIAGASYMGLRDKPAVLWINREAGLPMTTSEEALLLDHFPQLRVIDSADEARKSLDASDIGLLHVAAHARHNSENQMFSYVQFADGRVYATEIARSPLRCNLVVLSACESAKLSAQYAAEPAGLVRAFLARGCDAAIGSQWLLDDEAAAVMSTSFYHALLQGAGIKESLREARRKVKAWKPHVYYWGAFALFAGYPRERP